MKIQHREIALLKAIPTENSIAEPGDLNSPLLLLIALLFKTGLILRCFGFLITSQHLRELSLLSFSKIIPIPLPHFYFI